jgi:ribosomal protein S18 acetylase RimI-like enzyme
VGDLTWSVRPATIEDAAALAEIVIEATKVQGLWPSMSHSAEVEWRNNFIYWSGKQVTEADPGNSLNVIEGDGQPIGRLRIVRELDHDKASGGQSRRIELAGIQLRPAWQRRGIGTAVIRELQEEAAGAQIPLDIRVGRNNVYARRLYERLGCVHLGEDGEDYLLRWSAPTSR